MPQLPHRGEELHHNLNAAMTNLSHVVNHLSFGTPLASSTERKLSKYAQFQANYLLDGGRFISPDFHQAHHHYSKVERPISKLAV